MFIVKKISKAEPCSANKGLSAFSLVEMLMALLVASVLLAALAPVMTKKMDEGAININGTNNKKLAGTPCTAAEILAGECMIPQEAEHINVILVSGGGGGGGAVRGVEGSNVAIAKNTDFAQRYISILPGTKNLVLEMMSGGGGGGGGGGYSRDAQPAKRSDCEPFGVYVSKAQNGGSIAVCVSKYNPAQNGNYRSGTPNSSISGVVNVSTGTNCTGGNCCWHGQTANPCQEPSSCSGFTGCTVNSSFKQIYGACRRSVCQWNAANTICNAWDPQSRGIKGRLPSQTELTSWANYVKNSGVLQKVTDADVAEGWRGMQLCDVNAGQGTLQCAYGIGNCPGSANGYCYARTLWSSSAIDTTEYHRGFNLGGGVFSGSACDGTRGKCFNTFAFTARCVLERVGVFGSFTGGGGGAGAYVKVQIPDKAIEYATANNTTARLYMTAGEGGAGGAKSSTVRGASGGKTVARLTNANNTEDIWYLEVLGGTGGAGATSPTASTEGIGGVYGAAINVEAAASCVYMNKAGGVNSKISMKCADIPDILSRASGENGTNGGKGTEYANNGKGGKPPVVNGVATSSRIAGAGGSVSSAQAVTPAQADEGGGGGGGNCYTTAYGVAATCGAGGKGGNGYIKGSYTPTCTGAGGGGGGAGVVLHLKNIPTGNLGGLYFPAANISVGNGGAGGVEGRPGAPGTNTSITINNRKYEVTGGKGGEAGTLCSINGQYITAAVPGAKGDGGKVTSSTNNNMETPGGPTSWTTVPVSNDDYIEATSGTGIINLYGATGILSKIIAAGGNGGLVKSLSDAESGTLLTYPCGGFSTAPKASCNNSSREPSNLQTKYLDYEAGGWIPGNTYLNGGAPGGGGGAWELNAGGAGYNGGEASAGARGTNGTVYMYFE